MKRSQFALLLAAGLVGSCSRHVATRDRIRIALDADPPTLNLLLGDDPNTFDVGMVINSFLLRTNANGDLIPDLALQVPTLENGGISRDGRTLRYELRPNSRWHDGAPITAADVAFTLDLVNRPDVNIADRSGYDRISDVRVVTQTVIEIRLKAPYSPGVATVLSTAANQPYPVLPKHILSGIRDINHTSYNNHPIASGPYLVREWRHGDYVLLERYEHYFRGVPPTRYLEMRVVPSNEALIGLWRDGEIDVAGLSGERELLDTFQKWQDTHVEIYRRNTLVYLLFQHENSVLSDERVRRAIEAGIDRDRIMQNTLGTFYSPAEGDRPPGSFGYDAHLKQQRFDPMVSEHLLDQAGWIRRGNQRVKEARPLELSLVTSQSYSTRQIAIQVQAALAKIGVTVTLRQHPSSILFAPDKGIASTGRFDLFIGGWAPGGIADTSYLYRCDTRPPSGENYSRICDGAVDQAARLEISAIDPALQQLGDVEMQRALTSRAHVLFLGFLGGALATRKGLEGFKPSRIVRTFWNPWEWRWR